MIRAIRKLGASKRSNARSVKWWGNALSLMAILVASPVAKNADANSVGQPGPDTVPAPEYDPLSLRTVRLWEGAAPGSHGTAPPDIPTLTIVPPDGLTPVGAAVIVAPSGGYQILESGRDAQDVRRTEGLPGDGAANDAVP